MAKVQFFIDLKIVRLYYKTMMTVKDKREFLYQEKCILRKTNKKLKKLNRYSKYITKVSKLKYGADIVSDSNKKWADLMDKYLHGEMDNSLNECYE